MNYFKLIFVTFILFAFSSKANDVQIIELHKNKSLDQLVLETENNANDSINIENDNTIVEENNIMTVSQEQKDAVRTLFTKKLKDYISKDKIHFWI